MNRRDFLKIVGITTATSTAALYGCGSKEGSSEGSKVLGPIPTDKMTYRSFPGLGSDKVSILGYGCMRWPTVPAPDGKGEITVYADIISTPALALLCEAGIETTFAQEVPHIINRDKTGWCPLETACMELNTVEEMYPVIQNFISRIRAK